MTLHSKAGKRTNVIIGCVCQGYHDSSLIMASEEMIIPLLLVGSLDRGAQKLLTVKGFGCFDT